MSKSFFTELKRRNVMRMAGLYLVGAWLFVQVAGTLLPVFDAPAWVMKTLVGLLAVGLAPALIFSWAFELTPAGLKREEEVAPDSSVAPHTARRMDRTIMVVLALALAYFAFDKFVLAPKRAAAPAGLTTAEKPKLTEAEKLIQQAHALIDDPLAVRENYRLAEEVGQKAVQLNPTDAEAWAVLAQASLSLVAGRYDDTPARREAAGSQAERAIRLAPDSLESGLAMAGHLLVSRQFSESESRARELLRRFPTDQRVVDLLAMSLHFQKRDDEVRELLQQHASTPRGRTEFLEWDAYDHFDKNELVEADALLDQLFATTPGAGAYMTRLLTLWAGWGDLPAAAQFVDKIPSQLLLEDAFAHHAANVWMEIGQTEKALEALRRIPREFLEEKRVIRPKGLVVGNILNAAGRTEAAKVEWRQALALVEKRIAADPGRSDWVRLKALLLGRLGEKTEGEKQLKLWLEMIGPSDPDQAFRLLDVQMALGNSEEVIRGFQSVINSKKGRWLTPLNFLRHDPFYAPIRSDSRVQEMIAAGEAWLENLREEKARQTNGAGSSSSTMDNRSIAVLAFTNLSDDKGNEYFSDGISEELLNVLSKVPGLKVSARTSAFHFKGKDTPIPEIARQLGVAYVVEGSVRKSGDRVRITAQLIKAADGFHVWSENFDRELKDIFAVQDEIAGLIAKNLQLKLDAGNVAGIGATKNMAAYEAFLKGRQAWNSDTTSGYREAVQKFLQAIELDPDFALAHGALAEAYVSVANNGLEPAKKMFPLARASAERALALDNRIVQAHTALAEYAFHYLWDYEKSDRYLQQALAVDPNYSAAHARLSGHFEIRNRLKEALAEGRRAKELNPLDVTAGTSWTLILMKKYPDAIEAARREIALSPQAASLRLNLGLALFLAGKRDEALSVLEAIVDRDPTETDALAYLGWAYGRSGQAEKARKVLDRLTAIGAARFVPPRYLAIVATGLNDRDLAMAQLEQAFELRDPRLPSIGNTPGFEPIRADPRFRNLLKRLKLDVYFPEAPNK